MIDFAMSFLTDQNNWYGSETYRKWKEKHDQEMAAAAKAVFMYGFSNISGDEVDGH